MQNKNIALVILGVIVSFFIIRSIFFEKKDVSTENWFQNFDYENKDPYGGYIFYELIKNKFGKDRLAKHHIDTLITEIESSNNLYVLLSQSRYLSSKKQNELKEFIAKGNSALLISKNHYREFADTTTISFRRDFKQNNDTIFKFKFIDQNNLTDSMSYKHYANSNIVPSSFYPNTFNVADRDHVQSLASKDSINSFFFRSKLDTGVIYQHVFPELFSNIAATQEFYLEHFSKVFNYFDAEFVIIDHQSFDKTFEDTPVESPLQYILGQKSLKWAYYTFLFTTLGFLFFRGKRKQRVIPIPEKNENTSIQYVDTLSNLFELQKQNEKLVPHMETVFLQRVKKKYYLSPDHENFVELLSKKSKIPENQISAILKYFNTGKGIYNFSDDQLIMLHKRLEEFYKKAE